MTLGAYGKSITASVLIHLLAIIIVAQWGIARGRYDSNTRNAISVRLETEPKTVNKNSNTAARKAAVTHRPIEKEVKFTVVPKENAIPAIPVSNTKQLVSVEGDELNDIAAKESKTAKLSSYEVSKEDEVYGDPVIESGSDIERSWRPVLIGRIRAAIQDAVFYPPLARKRGLEGTVLAVFSIDESGLPQDIKVLKGSGHGMLDREVKRIIERASPYPPIKGTIEVPVIFRLKG